MAAACPEVERDVYSGTLNDRALLIADECLTVEDDFQVVTDAEVRDRLTAWVILKTWHVSFWRGYNLGRADATPTLKDSWLKAILRRIGLG